MTPAPRTINHTKNHEQHVLHVLIADKFEPAGIDALKALGCLVHIDPDLAGDSLTAALAEHNPDVLIVRGTKVAADAVEAAKNLSLIVRAGAGYDSIDVAAASARGVFVANCPGKNAIAVAELTLGLILCCDRRIPDQTADLQAGIWNKREYAQAEGLRGKTLGIVGLGQIGQEVAKRAKVFGMDVVAWSRSLTQDRADELGVGYISKLINLARMADVVSIHIAGNAETTGLINKRFFNAMKDHACFINTSRSSVVDEAALMGAIKEKGIRAGLDVFSHEPAEATGSIESPILKMPGVYGTHHLGASTQQAQQAIAAETVRIIQQYIKHGQVPNCVNRAVHTSATTLLTIRHINRPGVLAHVFYTLGQAGINVEEMENIIYDGARAACARIQLDDLPSDAHLNAITSNENVLSVTLTQLPKPQ